MNTVQELGLYVEHVARDIENLTDATEYLEGAADIQFIVSKTRKFLGGRVQFMNDETRIIIDTFRGSVEVFDLGVYARAHLWCGDALNRALGELCNR
jgi:hypothetical protein